MKVPDKWAHLMRLPIEVQQALSSHCRLLRLGDLNAPDVVVDRMKEIYEKRYAAVKPELRHLIAEYAGDWQQRFTEIELARDLWQGENCDDCVFNYMNSDMAYEDIPSSYCMKLEEHPGKNGPCPERRLRYEVS